MPRTTTRRSRTSGRPNQKSRSPSPRGAVAIVLPEPERSGGFFARDSWIDRLDKRASSVVFLHDAWHPWLDRALLVPGTWLGLPTPTWGWISLWLSASDDIEFIGVGLATLVYGFWYVRAVIAGHALHIYSPRGQLPIPLALWLGVWASTGSKPSAGAFFAVSWSVAQAICHVLKVAAGRHRPVASIADLASVKREFPALIRMMASGHTAVQSFPSADAVGGGALTCALVLLERSPFHPATAMLPVLIASFGRMYYHAHHLLDVVAGAAVGVGTTIVVARSACRDVSLDVCFDPRHVLLSGVLFVLVYLLSSRLLKPHLPKHLESRDGAARFKEF